MSAALRLLVGDASGEHFMALSYRISAYALLTLGEDVALLALIFC